MFTWIAQRGRLQNPRAATIDSTNMQYMSTMGLQKQKDESAYSRLPWIAPNICSCVKTAGIQILNWSTFNKRLTMH